MKNVTGHIQVTALTNMIQSAPASSAVAYNTTMKNIRDCISAGDEWFYTEETNGFRVFTDSGFSAIVANKGFLSFEARQF